MIEKLYTSLVNKISDVNIKSRPYIRRIIRLIALPYCYFKMINWQECNASRIKVLNDLVFIFFKYKYFPDNYSLCRLWEKDRSLWVYYYGSIYDSYQRSRLRQEVQPEEYKIVLEDKYICYQLCKAAGLPLPDQLAVIDPSDDCKLVIKQILEKKPSSKLIIKPVRGMGGKDIILAYCKNGQVFIKNVNDEIALDDFTLRSRSVVQEYVVHHESLSHMSVATSTVRIVTLLTRDGNVIVVGALMRFSIGHTYVDNTSQGGIAIGIDTHKGVLKNNGFDFNSRVYKKHPLNMMSFDGFKVPMWDDVLTLAKKTQLAFPYYKMLGQDIAICQSGPVIIEINGEHDNVGLEQSYGPILADEIVRHEFTKYNLMVNKHINNMCATITTIA